MAGGCDAEEPEAGFVLLAIVAIVLIFTIVTTTFTVRANILARQASNRSEMVRLGLIVDGAARYVAADFASTGFRPDGSPADCALRDGTQLRLSVVDQGGLADLNASPVALLADVAAAAGLDAELARTVAAQIVDFRDPDDEPQSAGGAERAQYAKAGLGWGPRNGHFIDVDELIQLPALTPELISRLSPFFTVYNPSSGLDLGVMDREAVLRMAGGRAGQSLAKWNARSPGRTFLARVEGLVAGRTSFRREIVFSRADQNGPATILKWARGSVDRPMPDAGSRTGAETGFCRALQKAF